MKKSNQPKKSKKLIILTIIGTLFITLLTFSLYQQTKTHPLGNDNKLEYIGKEDYGCILPICDSGPSSVYYYGTDMTVEEVVGYFEGAEIKYPTQKRMQYTLISLHPRGDPSKTLFISFYTREDDVAEVFKSKTSKTNFISIGRSSYEMARSAL